MKILKYIAIMAVAMLASATYAQQSAESTAASTLAANAADALTISVDTQEGDSVDSVIQKFTDAINAKYGEGSPEATSALATLMAIKSKLPTAMSEGSASLTLSTSTADDGTVSVDASLVHSDGTVTSSTTSQVDPVSGSTVTTGTVSEIAPDGTKVDSETSLVTDSNGNVTGSVGSATVADSVATDSSESSTADKTSTTSESSPDNSQVVSSDL